MANCKNCKSSISDSQFASARGLCETCLRKENKCLKCGRALVLATDDKKAGLCQHCKTG